MIEELELEAEAEKYSDYSNDNIPLSFGGKYNESHKRTFIAGAKSKFVERQKLEFAKTELEKFRSKLGGYDMLSGLLKQELEIQIYELEKKLSEL
jgi:hypothetical protein